jgi:20S proteasome subunit beta 6
MAAMFSQNPLMSGPSYSFNQGPTTAAGGNKEHSFYPYAIKNLTFSTFLTF